MFDLAYSAANHHNRQDIIDSILTTHYTSGSTATRSALEHVRDNIFSASHDMRRHSKKKLIVLTDGTECLTLSSSLVPRPSCAPGEESLVHVVFACSHKLPQNVCTHANPTLFRIASRYNVARNCERTAKQLPCVDQPVDLDPRSSDPTRQF